MLAQTAVRLALLAFRNSEKSEAGYGRKGKAYTTRLVVGLLHVSLLPTVIHRQT